VKFSILLPTRDRLEFLADAMESVRAQEGDWEVVVSDNRSSQDICGYVDSLGDDRIRYVRTEEPVPVTDNWNNALAHARGDYIVMLGDDDALLPGYTRMAERLIHEFDQPEAIYTGAYQYAWPGVLPNHPGGRLIESRTALLRDHERPYRIGPEDGHRICKAAMRFEVPVSFNMQHWIVSRQAIERVARGNNFYRPPYPDYYATNALFLLCEDIVVQPNPCAVIGVSNKSFGWFYNNNSERNGFAFLGIDPQRDRAPGAQETRPLLDGLGHINAWLLTMEQLEREFGEEHEIAVDYAMYRKRQLFEAAALHLAGDPSGRELFEAMRHQLTSAERRNLVFKVPGGLGRLSGRLVRLPYRALRRIMRPAGIRRHPYAFDIWGVSVRTLPCPYRSMMEFVRDHPIDNDGESVSDERDATSVSSAADVPG